MPVMAMLAECVECSSHACLYTQVVLDWFGKLLGLPQQFLTYASDGKQLPGGGVIQV